MQNPFTNAGYNNLAKLLNTNNRLVILIIFQILFVYNNEVEYIKLNVNPIFYLNIAQLMIKIICTTNNYHNPAQLA
jgi:hypothetical protein